MTNVGIDSDLSWLASILMVIYVGFLCFSPNKWRWVQIGICLGIAALSFFRVLLGVQMFVPIVFGSTWLLNAVILITVKLITERPSKLMKYPEINLVENRTYVAEVRPKKW